MNLIDRIKDLNRIKDLLSPSVDSITASLSHAVNRLDKLAAKKDAHTVALRTEAVSLHAKADQAAQEAARAVRTSARIARPTA